MYLAYILFILILLNKEEAFTEKTSRVDIIAHRGASDYAPENTLAAFDKAIQCNTDYLEFDIQMSEDGEIIVIHDSTVDRTTNGSGDIVQLNVNQLKKMDAGSWFNSSFTGEVIPTLDEVLKRYKGKTNFLIEVKNPAMYEGIEGELVQRIRRNNLEKDVVIQSFDHYFLKKMVCSHPNISTCLLLNGLEELKEGDLDYYSEIAKYINIPFFMLDHQVVKKFHSLGMKVYTWGIDSTSKFRQMMSIGVDGIITNDPCHIRNGKGSEENTFKLNDFIGVVSKCMKYFIDYFEDK